MCILSLKTCWRAACVLIGVAIVHPTAATADGPENFQVVDGVAIYLGVMPAELIQGHLKGQEEAKMHGGVSARSHRDHVVVALFDSETGERIEDAQVTTSVTELGLDPVERELESMHIADTITYGNYFAMASGSIYHINVRIRRPGVPGVVQARFAHRHFGN